MWPASHLFCFYSTLARGTNGSTEVNILSGTLRHVYLGNMRTVALISGSFPQLPRICNDRETAMASRGHKTKEQREVRATLLLNTMLVRTMQIANISFSKRLVSLPHRASQRYGQGNVAFHYERAFSEVLCWLAVYLQ